MMTEKSWFYRVILHSHNILGLSTAVQLIQILSYLVTNGVWTLDPCPALIGLVLLHRFFFVVIGVIGGQNYQPCQFIALDCTKWSLVCGGQRPEYELLFSRGIIINARLKQFMSHITAYLVWMPVYTCLRLHTKCGRLQNTGEIWIWTLMIAR